MKIASACLITAIRHQARQRDQRCSCRSTNAEHACQRKQQFLYQGSRSWMGQAHGPASGAIALSDLWMARNDTTSETGRTLAAIRAPRHGKHSGRPLAACCDGRRYLLNRENTSSTSIFIGNGSPNGCRTGAPPRVLYIALAVSCLPLHECSCALTPILNSLSRHIARRHTSTSFKF